MIAGRWLERALIWLIGVWLAFPRGQYFSVARLKITSKKLVWIRLVSMVIENTSCGNNAMIFFLILLSLGLFALFIAASPPSLYKPTALLSIAILDWFNK